MSNSLLFLQPDDFHLEQSEKGYFLCNSIKDFSFLLFYGKQCPNCQVLLPIIKKLPGKIHGVFFGLSLVNNALVKLSHQTLLPIEFVPLMVLYYNGRPILRYESAYTEAGIVNFIIEVIKRLNARNQFYAQNKQQQPIAQVTQQLVNQPQQGQCKRCMRVKKSLVCKCHIPPYSIGHTSESKDDVTYLEFNEAYEIKNRY